MNKELQQLLEKLAALESLTKEEKELLGKINPQGPPIPNRRVDLSDAPKGDVRTISKFYGDEKAGLIPDDPKSYSNAERELVDCLDRAYIAGAILGKRPNQLKMWTNFFDRNSALAKALAEATSTQGAEWVPTLLSAAVYQMFYLKSPVAQLFAEIAMPSNPFNVPYSFDLDDGYYYVPESQSDEASKSPTSNITTGLITLTARKFKRRILFSDELDEDSIVPVLPNLREQIVTAGARALENAIINGDTTAPHMDADVTDPKDIRKIWLGLRKLCPAGTKVDLSTFSTATLMSIRTLMSKWGMDPSQLAWIPGPKSYNKMLGLTEVLTIDKFGPDAVIQAGELAALLGVPILPSEKIREDLDATGVRPASPSTYTIALIVNKGGFILGSRGTAKVKLESEGAVDQNQLTVSFRKAFTTLFNPANYPTIGLAFKIS